MSSCEFPRCSNGAEFCFADEPGVPRFCATHKDDTTMIPIKSCEFPRCEEAPIYCFTDEVTVARFCQKHKCDDMILIAGATAPLVTPSSTAGGAATATAAASGVLEQHQGPSPATLELAFKYFELKPEHDSLDTIKVDAATHRAKLDKLRHQIKKEDEDIHKISKGIEKLETQLGRQDKKLLNFGGRSLFGQGILMKDQKQVDKMSGEKKTNEKQKEVLESHKSSNETNLSSMLTEQARLNNLVEIRKALEARIKDLRDECLEAEGTTLMRRLQASKTDHDRMHRSLTFCKQDLMTAHNMFQKALQIQATAARSNAIAAGANIGQAIGGGGGRGIGNSPGERLMQIRRNQATKQSIQLAQQACDKLNTAQHRLDNDLRVKFPDEMNGVGNVTIPDLWHGSFFRDFLVGQAAGNVGDAINQARAMKKIRKNMEELEKIIAVCVNQEQKLDVVNAKLVGSIAALEKDVFAEEKRIIQGVIEVAKAAQAATPAVQAETFSV